MQLYGGITHAVASIMGLFSPQSALRYVRGRQQLAMVAGYAAAQRDGSNGKWRPYDTNINLRNAKDRAIIQARARQLADDHPNLFGALDKIVSNVIYTGIRPQAQIVGRKGVPFASANDSVENDFKDWAEQQCWHELTELVLRHLWLDGGCLLHWYPRPDLYGSGLVPLGVELLELDSLDSSVSGQLPNGNRAFYGIEVNSYGAPSAFHVRSQSLFGNISANHVNYSGKTVNGTSYNATWGETVRLPVQTCRLIMRRRRIGQLLPVSWLASIINTIHDLDEYQSSERIAARLAAAFGVFVVLPEGQTGHDLNGNPRPALSGGADTLGRIVDGKEFISQGRIDALPHGTEIKAFEHNRPGSTYEPFIKTTQRGASSALSMSGESYSNDYTDASYSSVRQAVLEERRGYRLQQELLIREMIEPFWKIWTQFRASFLRGDARIPVRWQRPGWSWVDPLKDANAASVRISLGLVSRQMLCEEQGLDFEEVYRQQQEEQRMMDALQPKEREQNPEPKKSEPQKGKEKAHALPKA